MMFKKSFLSGSRRGFFALGLALTLAACGAQPAPEQVADPQEAENRQIHAFNKGLDRAFVRPASGGYGAIPQPVQIGIANFAENLDGPGEVVNYTLQARPGQALNTTGRFLLNSTIGVLGFFDPATRLGLPERETDFGETLHVWGAPEGNYGELPALGPTTTRDTVGMIVDTVLNPLRLILPDPERNIATFAGIGSTLGDRDRYSGTLDSVLYGSADSYAQTRLLYIQNRRFELGQTAGGADDGFLDPYAEAEGEAAVDGSFIDPYEDSNAE